MPTPTSSSPAGAGRTLPGWPPGQELLDSISKDSRLQDAYGGLVRDGWTLRRDDLWFRSATIDSDDKLLLIDDDSTTPVSDLVGSVRRAVRMAYQEAEDLRRSSERDRALAIFRTGGLTALERMAQTYEWSVWYWLWPLDIGNPHGLMDDMVLVLTESTPDLRSTNDGRYHIFSAARLGYSEDTTGFKVPLRENSPQVRHATGSIQASLTAGSVGYLLSQLSEWLGHSPSPADYRLNRACFELAQKMLVSVPGWTAAEIGQTLRRHLGDPAQTGPWTGPPGGVPDA